MKEEDEHIEVDSNKVSAKQAARVVIKGNHRNRREGVWKMRGAACCDEMQ